MKYLGSFAFMFLMCAVADFAYAADGHALPWGNFGLRVLNLAIFIGILWYAGGKLVKAFLAKHQEQVKEDLENAKQLKIKAEKNLAMAEERLRSVEGECQKLLEEGKAQAEAIKASIIADAEKQAERIVEQAKLAADQDVKSEIEKIKAQMADEIVAQMEKEITARLKKSEHNALIEKSLSKVVFS